MKSIGISCERYRGLKAWKGIVILNETALMCLLRIKVKDGPVKPEVVTRGMTIPLDYLLNGKKFI